MSDQCLMWIKNHSGVDAVRVAAGIDRIGGFNQRLEDFQLTLEIQKFVFETVSSAMVEAFS